jgi:hypothetical protein
MNFDVNTIKQVVFQMKTHRYVVIQACSDTTRVILLCAKILKHLFSTS